MQEMIPSSPRLPTILLIEPDDVVRPILKDNLRRWGYTVIVTENAADALQRTQGGGTHFDLILLNQFEQSIDDSIAIGRYILQQAAVSNQTPLVILAENYGVEVEGQNIQIGDSQYVTYLEDGEQLKNLLYNLCLIQRD